MNSFRKFTAALAALAVTMTSVFTFSVAVAATTFTDASGIASWALNSVTSLADTGVLSGRPDGSFDPQGQLNRAEVAKVATLAAGLTEDTTGAPHFNDVASADWFYSYVETLYNNGVVGGINGGALDSNGLATYNPSGTLNRAEGSKILVDAFDLETSYSGTPPNFPDVASSAWFYDYAETAFAHGIVNGYSNGNFGPGDAITREQIAVIAQSGVVEAADSSKRRSDYTAGAASSVEPSETPVTPSTSDGDLNVAISASTPAAQTFPVGAAGTAVAAYDFTATSDDVAITNLVIKRTGVGNDAGWTLYLYDGVDRLTSGKTINSTSHEATFTGVSVTVAAGTTKTLTLKADSASTGAGDSYFEIAAAESVTSNAQSVGGSFPVKSNKQEINTSITAGTITIERNGSITDPKVGEDNVTVAKFKLTTATEAGLVEEIALVVDGTISATDVQNAKLYQGDTLLASTTAVNSKDLLVFDLDTPFTIEKGDSRNFEVQADLNTGRGSDTVKIYLDEDTDLVANGGTYGFGMTVDSDNADGYDNSDDDGTDGSHSTLQGGDITITSSGPTATDIAANAKDVTLMDFGIVSVSEVTVKKFGIYLTTSNTNANPGDDGGLLNDAGVSNYTDIKIVNTDTGAVLMGPIDANVLNTATGGSTVITYGNAVTSVDKDGYYTFTDEFSMAAGESLNLALTADIANNTDATFVGDVIYASLDLNNTSVLEIKDINNKTITNSSSVVPTSDITGKSMTIASASLTVTAAATPVSDTFVKGTAGVEIIGLAVAAGSASDVKVTEMVVRVRANTTNGSFNTGNAAASDFVNNIELWVGDVKIAGPEGLTVVTALTGYYKATFDNMDYTVSAGDTIQMTVKGDISSSATAILIGADIDPDNDITAEDNDGNTVTAGGISALNDGVTQNPVVTVAITGGITVAEEDSPDAAIIIAGAQGINLGQYKVTATDEAQTLKDFVVTVTGTTDVTGVVAEYEDADGTTISSTATVSGGEASFKDETFYIGKDESAVLTLKANLNTISAGAVSGDAVQLTLKTGAFFKAVGEGSGTTETTIAVTGTTSAMYIRETAPTIAKATGLSTTLVTGTNTLYGFTVASDAAGAISWKSVRIKLTGSIAADGTLNDFKLYKGSTDKTSNVGISVVSTTTAPSTIAPGNSLIGTGEDLADTTDAKNITLAVEWNDASTSKETISAGSSSTYYLKAAVAGVATNDSLTASIEDDGSTLANRAAVVTATDVRLKGAGIFTVGETTDTDNQNTVGTVSKTYGVTDAVTITIDTEADGTLGTNLVVENDGNLTACAAYTSGDVALVAGDALTGISYVYCTGPASSIKVALTVTAGSADNNIVLAVDQSTAPYAATVTTAGATTGIVAEVYGIANSKTVTLTDNGDVISAIASNDTDLTCTGDVMTLAGLTKITCAGADKTLVISPVASAATGEVFTLVLTGYAPGTVVGASNTDLGLGFNDVAADAYSIPHNFVWSDQSNTAHATTTADWTNGHLVDSLATESLTLQK